MTGLPKDTITINLAKTIGEKNDDKITPPDQMAVVRDARFQKDYALDKRNGLTTQGTSFQGDPGFINPVAFGSSGPRSLSYAHEDQLILVNNGNLFSQYHAQDNWIFRGTCVPIGINISSVDALTSSTASRDLNFVDCASVNGITVAISWTQPGRGVNLLDQDNSIYVIEESTGNVIKKTTIPSGTSGGGGGTESVQRVLPFANSVLVATQNTLSGTTTIYVRSVSLTTGSVGSAIPVVQDSGGIRSSAMLGTSSTLGNVALLLCTIGTVQSVVPVSAAGTVHGIGTLSTTLGTVYTSAQTIMTSPSNFANKFWVGASGSDSGIIEGYTISSTYAQNFSTTFGTSAAFTNYSITMGLSPINNSDIYLFTDAGTRASPVAGTKSDDDFLRMVTVGSTGVVSNNVVYGRGYDINAQCFVDTGRKTIYLPIVYYSTLQKTSMIADMLEGKSNNSTYIVGKCLYGTAKANATTFNPTPSTRQTLPLTSGSNVFRTVNGRNFVDINLTPDNAAQSQYYAKTTHTTGGILWAYDGINVNEHGFLIGPENLTVGSTSSGSGTIAGGSYQVTFCYHWQDRNGQSYRSLPAVARSVNTGGGAGASIEYTISAPPITNRDPSSVQVEIYSTAANGSTFFLQTTATMSSASSVIAGTVSAVAFLTSSRQLYTTGNILENATNIGACSSVWFFKERLCANAGDDPQAVMYSKTNVVGEPVNFAEELSFRVDADQKEVSAGITMDDKMIVFKDNKIYVMSGDGANDTGQGDTFQPPMLIASDVGCGIPNSAVLYSGGVLFSSSKGIYKLNRGLSVEYVGDKVEDYNSFRISSGVLMDTLNEVRYCLQNGSTGLVYNYYFNRWDLFSNYQADSACIWQNTFTLVRSSGTVAVENSNYYDVSGAGTASYNMYVETPWLKLKGIQDFQRLYSLMFLGDYFTPHTLRVELKFNYIDTVVDTFNFDSAVAVSDPPYQFQAFPTLQKCESVKIAITVIPSTGSQRAITLNELGAVVGLKQGLFKIPAVKRA